MMTSKGFIFNKKQKTQRSDLSRLGLKFFRGLTSVFFVFCILVLMQTTFFGHIAVYGAKLNLVFIAVFLLSFFESLTDEAGKKSNGLAVSAGFIGGFLLDIFSSLPFGVFTFTFLLLAFLVKKSHLFFHKSSRVAFLIAFLLSFLFYKICFAVFSGLFVLVFEGRFFFVWPMKLSALIELLYNFIIAGLVFLFFWLKTLKT